MASGVIIADCPICGEFIWEDQDFTVSDRLFKHRSCVLDSEYRSLLRKVMNLNKENKRILIEVINVLLLAQELKD